MKNYIPTFEAFNAEQSSPINEEKYEYGCAMLYFEFPEMSHIQDKIEEGDLKDKGLEDEPHVTLLYGLHSDEIDDNKVIEACTAHEIRSIKLCNVSAFSNDEQDVLKFDAEAQYLHDINAELVKLPHTTSFPDYHPHCTIAYLKAGKAKPYIDAFMDRKFEVYPTKIVYSKPDGSKVTKAIR